MKIDDLFTVIESRKKNLPDGSYVASLFKKGKDRIIQKVGEEAVEVVIAAKNEDKGQIISEMADLWFHSLILLSALEVKPEEVLSELEKEQVNSAMVICIGVHLFSFQ